MTRCQSFTCWAGRGAAWIHLYPGCYETLLRQHFLNNHGTMHHLLHLPWCQSEQRVHISNLLREYNVLGPANNRIGRNFLQIFIAGFARGFNHMLDVGGAGLQDASIFICKLNRNLSWLLWNCRRLQLSGICKISRCCYVPNLSSKTQMRNRFRVGDNSRHKCRLIITLFLL